MKLSEAIRLNGIMKPQGRGNKSMHSIEAPCALGGAVQSIGGQPNGEYAPITTTWPFVFTRAECPCGNNHGMRPDKTSVLHIIAALNDVHGWTRNQIADWVATVEPDEPPTAEAEHEVQQLEKKGA